MVKVKACESSQTVLNSKDIQIWFLFQVWPEVTDPEKFVYEDVAIATYLLVSGWF